ncbi:MAG: MFS transporter [Thermomicrobiales bacterium]|nr:MFS transporter [Thermomicrobiales bacterium]
MLRNKSLIVLMSGHFFNDILVGVLPVLFPSFKSEFGLSNAELGLIALAYAVSSSLTQPLFGYISDIFRRWWLTPLLVLWSGCWVGLYGFASSYAQIFVVAILAGLGSAAFHPLGATNAVRVVGEKRRNTSMSLYTVAGSTGFALGPLVTVILIGQFGLYGTLGFTVMSAVAAAFMVPEMRRIKAIDDRTVERSAISTADQGPAEWGMLTRVIISVMLRSMTMMAILQFTPVWFDELGYSSTFYGALVTVIMLMAAAGIMAGGWFADRIGGKAVVVGSIAMTLPLLLIYTQLPGTSSFVSGAAFGLTSDASIAISLLAAQRLLPGRTGLASSTILGIGFVSGGLGVPVIGGIIDSVGYETGLGLLVLVNLAAMLLASTIPARVWGLRSNRAATIGADRTVEA